MVTGSVVSDDPESSLQQFGDEDVPTCRRALPPVAKYDGRPGATKDPSRQKVAGLAGDEKRLALPEELEMTGVSSVSERPAKQPPIKVLLNRRGKMSS